MQNNLISIIVPVYNVEKYVGKCLDSIIHQTYTNLEIIVVDDGSTDASGKICEDYAKKDSRIKVIHQKNGGTSSARNNGIEHATGVYISFVDSDDWIESNHIKNLVAYCKQHHADIAVCGINFLEQNRSSRPFKIKTESLDRHHYTSALIYNFQGYTHNKLYTRSIIGKTRFDTNLTICEDYYFNMQIAMKLNKAVAISQYTYNYISHNTSAIHKDFSGSNLSELKARELIYNLLGKKFADLAPLFLLKSVAAAYRQKHLYKKSHCHNQQLYAEIKNFIHNNEKLVFHSSILSPKQKISLMLYKYTYPVINTVRNTKAKLCARRPL